MSLIWIVNILSVFFLCVFFAGIVIPQILLIAFRRRLFDEPDERKIHQCVVPRLGGMAFKPVVFFSFVLLLAVNVSTGHDELLKEIGAEALPLAYAFCAIIMLYLVGIADDLIGVRYRAKFFIQIVCGIMLVAGGVELSDLHGMLFIHSMPSWISIPLTVFVTVFIINAINLIDGIDGLASGLCSIAFLFYGMTFIWFHQYLYAMLAFATLGVLIPFYYYNVGASASWELDIFGKLTAAKRGAAAALQGSRAYRQAVQTQLVATIADSYYTLAMLDAQMTISNRTLENWRTTVRTLEALKKVGKSNEAGVLQAKANVMRLEASLLSIRKSISETENALSAILAMPSHSIGRSDLAEAAFPDTVSIGVPLQLLSNRPDVRQAEMELAQAFYATNAARAAFYPNITLSGILGWTNNGGGVIVNPGQWLLNAIGSLTQPLFNRGVNIANLKIAKSRQEEAKLLFRQSLLNAGKEVNDALTAWQTAKSQIEINARQVETLCDAVRKTESLMRHSNTTYLEVLTAKQSLLEAEVQQLQTRFERIQSIIKLYHALGGGM